MVDALACSAARFSLAPPGVFSTSFPQVEQTAATRADLFDSLDRRLDLGLGHFVGRHGPVFGVTIADAPSSGSDLREAVQAEGRSIRPFVAALFAF